MGCGQSQPPTNFNAIDPRDPHSRRKNDGKNYYDLDAVCVFIHDLLLFHKSADTSSFV